MNLSLRQLLAPFVGALLGWLTAHGVTAPPGAAELLVTLGAGLVSGLVHAVEVRARRAMAAGAAAQAAPAAPPPAPPSAGASGGNVASALLCALAAGAMLSLVGCASIGAAPPQSLDERIAYAVGTYQAVEDALAQAVQAHQVTAAEAARVDQAAGQARALLNAAHAAEQVDPAGAQTELARAAATLAALQAWVNSPGGGPAP